MKYHFIVKGKLNNLNDYINADRSNPYKGAKMKKLNQRQAEYAILSQLHGVHINKPVRMIYKWYEKNRRRDLDNISSFGRKVIQDALVETGVLKNDGWKDIKGFSDEFYIDADNPRIEITIEEV